MIVPGQVVKSDSGYVLRVESMIQVGAQGAAYWVSVKNQRERGVLKVFHDRPDRGEMLERLRFLVRLRLGEACPVIRAPTDIVSGGGLVGHYAPAAQGHALETFLANPTAPFVGNLQAALALSRALAVLEERQVAHGDLHAGNLNVHLRGSVLEVYLFDLDNYSAPGVPPPPCAGHKLYLAPELREALLSGGAVSPDLESDRFALGVLLHELVLLRHPAAGYDGSEEEFTGAMTAGRWLHDPAGPARPTVQIGGYPAEVVNAGLCRLFRKAFGADRRARPTAKEWVQVLAKGVQEVSLCQRCCRPCLLDTSRTACPHCSAGYHALKLVLDGGGTLLLDSGAVPVGRDQLGGSPQVSFRHAVFRRVGPETQCESFGRNGTYVRNGKVWHRLPEGKPVLILNGTRMRFGDVEGSVVFA